MQPQHWQAICACDSAYDGVFWYGVRTTRIFCRPSCASTAPRPENVEIFTLVSDALGAGYRPCKRCRPEDPGWYGPARDLAERTASVLAQDLARPLDLPAVARAVHASPWHLHRVFRAVTGETIRACRQRLRLEAAQRLLGETGMPISDVAQCSGFPSAESLARALRRTCGIGPRAYRRMHREVPDRA